MNFHVRVVGFICGVDGGSDRRSFFSRELILMKFHAVTLAANNVCDVCVCD